MELFRAFVDWFEARAKNPILGYFLVAQIFLHWQDYALLIWSEEPFQNRMIAFRAQNGVWELVAQPVAMAFCFAMILPFIAYCVSWVTQWAVVEHKSLKEKQIYQHKKLRLEQDLTLVGLRTDLENEIASAAQVRQQITENYDSDTIEAVTKDLEELNEMGSNTKSLTNDQVALLELLQTNGGKLGVTHTMPMPEEILEILGHNDFARARIELIDAAKVLEGQGLVKEQFGRDGGHTITISSKGYQALDGFYAA